MNKLNHHQGHQSDEILGFPVARASYDVISTCVKDKVDDISPNDDRLAFQQHQSHFGFKQINISASLQQCINQEGAYQTQYEQSISPLQVSRIKGAKRLREESENIPNEFDVQSTVTIPNDNDIKEQNNHQHHDIQRKLSESDDNSSVDSEVTEDEKGVYGIEDGRGKCWTIEEDKLLLELYEKLGSQWAMMCNFLPRWSRIQIKTRFKSISRAKKRMWKKSEDEILINHLKCGGRMEWTKIALLLPGRSKNSLKLRAKQLLNSTSHVSIFSSEREIQPGSPRQSLALLQDISATSEAAKGVEKLLTSLKPSVSLSEPSSITIHQPQPQQLHSSYQFTTKEISQPLQKLCVQLPTTNMIKDIYQSNPIPTAAATTPIVPFTVLPFPNTNSQRYYQVQKPAYVGHFMNLSGNNIPNIFVTSDRFGVPTVQHRFQLYPQL